MRQTTFEHAEKVSGEAFARNYMSRKVSCAGCPVGCIHIGQFKREFAEQGFEYETVNVAYDYELIFALGTFLGLSEPSEILELIEEVEIVGMDTMSTGVALGWATEALETGLISEEETIVPFKFGSYKEYCKAVHYIAAGENDFYKNLGKGVRHASSVYGGHDFAMHIAGNEMTGYHTGYGSLVGIAVAARHSHLCNAGYSLDQKLTSNDVDPDDFAEALLKEELERCMLNSLTLCLFSRGVYDREKILACFSAIGEDISDYDLTAAARRIYASKLRVKKALGFDLRSIRFPRRFFETPAIHGKLDESVAYDILMKYREKIQGMEVQQ
jgi:aldehyde:ferredoxin oxidoreductase